MDIVYNSIPDGLDFTSEFPTFIIAFCPDADIWFATNQRFHFYEYDKEFQSYEEAREYFFNNLKEFWELRAEMGEAIPFYDMSIETMYFSDGHDQITQIYRCAEIGGNNDLFCIERRSRLL